MNLIFEDNLKNIFEEVWAYCDFHSEISKYFNEGINLEPNKYEQEIYFVDYNWIESWKKYINYDNVILMGKDYYSLKENGLLQIDKNNYPGNIESGNARKQFLAKTVYEIKDFDCLIDKATYDYFRKYYKKINFFSGFVESHLDFINCIFLGDMFALIEKGIRIKIIFKYEIESNLELFQFNLVFKRYNKEIVPDLVKGIIDLFLSKDQNTDFCNYFIEKCLKKEKKRKEELIDILIEGYKQGKSKLYIKKYECNIKNLILYKKNIIDVKDDGNLELSLNNINSHRLIGLQNIGATCYMNATLQCLVNIKQFTNYLLNKNNFTYIRQKKDICEILISYCRLLYKLCCDKNVKHYYAPEDFKNIISLKNPLFQGIQANDSKDLIYFLLEQMNFELNQAKLKINPNLQKNINANISDQTNKQIELNNFIQEYSYENNNIIPKLFFSLIENESICNGCNTHKYNYQIIFSLEIPLEATYNKIYGNNHNNDKKLNLNQCIENFNEKSFFTGDNAMYCNACHKQVNSTYIKNLHSLSPIVIIILNRGKANQFQCDVDFPEEINFKNYILNPQFNYEYNLIGVVTHFGTSDMGGHFIAYCKHRTLNEWYSYNDATVTKIEDQKNGYKKGVPYILFYETKQLSNWNILFDYFNTNFSNSYNNNNIINNNNNFINNNNNFINNNNNFINNNNQMPNFNMSMPMNMFNNNYMNQNNFNNNMNYNINVDYPLNNMNQNQNNINNNINIYNNMGNNINFNQNAMNIINNNNINNMNGFNNNMQNFNNMNINYMPNQQMNMNNNLNNNMNMQ